MYLLYKNNRFIGISHVIIYGSVGGLLAIIFQNNKFEIDYYVADKLLYFESFKLILLSNIMSIIGYIVIKSGVVLGSISNSQGGEYLKFLVYVLCGYSQTFISNILKNFELQNANKGENTK